MSRTRREFIRLAGAGALSAGLVAPKDALGCCFGSQRRAVRAGLRSGPELWIDNPSNYMEIGRRFTAYGRYDLGSHVYGAKLTARLIDGDGNDYWTPPEQISWRTSEPLTWMANFVIPDDQWPRGDPNLTLEV